MKEQALADCKDTVHEVLRKLSEQDRDVMEKGIKAFVSFVRAYKEHQCKFIFRLADLDLAQLATALGLLKLPKMPEMRKTKQRLEGFTPSALDPNDVKVSFLHIFTSPPVSGLLPQEALAMTAGGLRLPFPSLPLPFLGLPSPPLPSPPLHTDAFLYAIDEMIMYMLPAYTTDVSVLDAYIHS